MKKKAFMINALARVIEEVQVETTEDLQNAVDGWTEGFRFQIPDGNVLYVNEEGLLRGYENFILIPFTDEGVTQYCALAGNGIICGYDEEGELSDSTVKEDFLNSIRFAGSLQVYLMAQAGKIAN